MTITGSQPPRGGSAEAAELTIRLEFIKPFASVATSGFVVKPEGDKASTATWSMEGRNNLMGKAFSVFMNMDKMIGGDFEKGLGSLKAIAEARRRSRSRPASAQGRGRPRKLPPRPESSGCKRDRRPSASVRRKEGPGGSG